MGMTAIHLQRISDKVMHADPGTWWRFCPYYT